MLSGNTVTKEWLKDRLAIEEAVSKISRLFLSTNTADLKEILSIIGNAASVNRACIICFDKKSNEITNSYEWCEAAPKNNYKNRDHSGLFVEWVLKKLKRDDIIMVPDVDALPDEVENEKTLLKKDKIRSILVIPIYSTPEVLSGAMIFENLENPREWLGEEVQTFRVISEMISTYWEREKAAEALEQSEKNYRELYEESKKAEEVYRSLINSSADAIVISDLDCKTNYINPTFTSLFGWTIDEVRGKEIPFIPSTEKSIQNSLISDIIQTGNPCQDIETSRLTKDGRCLEISLSVSRYDDHEGKPAGVLYLLRDISERKQLEAQLIQAQKMEAIGTLAGGIAHDFNNNLQAIFGCTQILLMGKDKNHPDYSKLSTIEKAIQRAGNLTKRLLIFGRKIDNEFVPVDLNHEVNQISQILERTIPKMIKIKLNLKKDIETIIADPGQLEQVMMNLGINARDAMPEGGELEFKTEKAIVDTNYSGINPGLEPGEYIILTVSDTGAGMDKGTLDHIFEPFFTTKKKGEGTGLGLAMVYSIIQSHGGYITCKSSTGKGSSFIIYFPAAGLEKNIETHKKSGPLIEGANENILFIEDDETNREIGKELLTKFGYRVFTASDCESAIDFYNKNLDKIDLIISDLIMPGIGGKKLLENILTLNPKARIIITSGYSAEETERQARELGAKDFISKPYEMSTMLRVVKKALD